MKKQITTLLVLLSFGAFAQTIVQPKVRSRDDMFKPNVPSLVVKANPFTLLLGYLDGGVEFRTKTKGWTFMTHSRFPAYRLGESFNPDMPTYEEQISYVRFAADHKWYYKPTPYQEKFAGFYATVGASWWATTDDVVVGSFQDYWAPSSSATVVNEPRIDFILGAEIGRVRNWFDMSSPFYGETSWKLGWNIAQLSPQLLYTIRLNYIVD